VAVTDDDGIELEVSERSQLCRELRSSTSVQEHFLAQLPHHCTMLVVGLADAYASLLALGADRPFACNAVARALMEAAADLYWLGTNSIDAEERARRTITIYLQQTESTVRQLQQLRDRTMDHSLDAGIAEGWSLLRATADAAQEAGYAVRSSKRAGQRYVLGTGKPSTSVLVDQVVSRFFGTTGVNVYSQMSSTAHAEGSGLGSLIDSADQRTADGGPRSAYGVQAEVWVQRYMRPCHAVAVGATSTWLDLALPERLPAFIRGVQTV
jgi:hypothetical protein